MSYFEIEQEIMKAKNQDGTFPGGWVTKMNRKGVWFEFRNDGIRWSRKTFG